MIAHKHCDRRSSLSCYIQPRRAFSISGNIIVELYMNND